MKMYGEPSCFTAQRIASLIVAENKKRLRKGEIDVVTQCVPRVRFPCAQLSSLFFGLYASYSMPQPDRQVARHSNRQWPLPLSSDYAPQVLYKSRLLSFVQRLPPRRLLLYLSRKKREIHFILDTGK